MKRMKVLSILCACLAVLLGAGYAYTSGVGFSGGALQIASATAIPQSVAQLGSLTVSTTGSGELVPVSEVSLGFQESGEITEVNVKVGDKVKAGAVLARLQTNKTPNELAADIASAELAVVEAQQSLDQLYENAELEAAQALSALEEAQINLDDVKDNELEQALAQQALAQAQEAVADAQMSVYILNSSPSQEAFDIAHASLLFKEKALPAIEKQIVRLENQIKRALNGKIRHMLKQQLRNLNVQVAQKRIDYEKALYQYNHMGDPADPTDVSVAEKQLTAAQETLAQAQLAWEKAQEGPTAGDIAQAEAEIVVAQATWERLKDGPNPDDVASATEKLTAAQAVLALAKQEQLVVDLVAPLDGSVLSVDAAQGDRITGSTILTLADLSQPMLEVYLDETDLDKVQVGNQAEIVFDAYPDRMFTGRVVEVDPSLADVRGLETVRVLVRMDVLPSAVSPTMPVGLNATVDIIAEQVSNAVLVPVEALHELSAGKYAVYVMQGDELELRHVSVGISDYTTTEIIDGLAAGEAVALGDVVAK